MPFRETETSESDGEHNSKNVTASRLEGTNSSKDQNSPSPSSKRPLKGIKFAEGEELAGQDSILDDNQINSPLAEVNKINEASRTTYYAQSKVHLPSLNPLEGRNMPSREHIMTPPDDRSSQKPSGVHSQQYKVAVKANVAVLPIQNSHGE